MGGQPSFAMMLQKGPVKRAFYFREDDGQEFSNFEDWCEPLTREKGENSLRGPRVPISLEKYHNLF